MPAKQKLRDIDRARRDLQRRGVEYHTEEIDGEIRLWLGNALDPVIYDATTGAIKRSPRPDRTPEDFSAESDEFQLK